MIRGRVPIIGGMKGKLPVIDANYIRPQDSFEARAAKMEFYYAKAIGEALVAAYPNRQWSVNVDLRNEMIVIGCPSLSNTKGYHLHLRHDNLPLLITRARRAAGEILERYGVTRGRIINPDILEALPRGLRDEVIGGSDTAPEPITRMILRA